MGLCRALRSLGFWGLGLRASVSGQGLGFRVQDFKVQDFKVLGLRFLALLVS